MITLKKIAKRILQYEARLVLRKYRPKVIAITGSVGKTLTKEAIYLVLAKKFFVRKSEKSFTNEVGIPLAVIGCTYGTGSIFRWIENLFLGLKLILVKSPYPEWLILEVDSDKPGDLQTLSLWLKPDILVMTAIGNVPSHIESFSTIENFVREKTFIINSVKSDGVVMYNADDSVASNILENTDLRKVACGLGGVGRVSGGEFEILYGTGKNSSIPTGMTFEASFNDKKYQITTLGSFGLPNEYAELLAFAVGIEFKLSPEEIVSSLNKYSAPAGRMNIISGIKDTVIIDDSYNSSPTALSQALEAFGKLKSTGKKIAVLGDMLELGKFSAEEHRKVAELLRDKAARVICVGLRSRKIAEELLDLGWSELNLISVDYSEEAGKELQRIIGEGDAILIKGSQAMRMEKVVEEVMRHPEDKEKLLVRQEKEWLER